MMQESDAQLIERGYTEERLHAVDGPKIILLWDKRWSPALVGLVAGRLLERYARPVVTIGHHEGQWIGSGRSISSYNITEAMRTSGAGILTRVGGHVQACGFAFEDESRLPELSERLHVHAAERLTSENLVPKKTYDAELDLLDVHADLIRVLDQFEPFGEGNPRPLFCTRRVLITSVGVMGTEGRHLRMTVAAGGAFLKCVGFGMGSRLRELRVGGTVDLLYHANMNQWNGREEPQAMLIDVCVL